MCASRLLRLVQRLISVLPFMALLLLLGTPSRAVADQGGARVFDISTTVPVESVEILPPSPCSEAIRVAGNFQLRAHIVIPPGSPAPGPMHVTLHLNTDGIRGTGLTTGAPYIGGQGGTASLRPPNPNFSFQSEFLLRTVPGSGQYRVNPCRIQPTFNVSLFSLAGGFNFNAALGGWGPHICFWSQLGSGTNSSVEALAVDGSGNLYAGGAFTMASPLSGVAAPMYIAKWDGKNWSALGSGMNNEVFALAVDGSGNLYAGGKFTALAGGGSLSHIAKWAGGFWYRLGDGVNNTVWALAVDGSGNLYAGGDFTTAGGTSVSDIAKWNGSSWSALGSGTSKDVQAIAVTLNGFGPVYVGGGFTTAGGVNANYVAEWNGGNWYALGSGTDGIVFALAARGSSVFAGGSFNKAGGLSANYIARWC